MKKTIAWLLAGGVVLTSGLVAGCGYDAGDYCDDLCDCSGCSDRQRDDCHSCADDAEVRADRNGCSNQYDDLVACAGDTGHCTSRGDWVVDCDPEVTAYARCMKGDIKFEC